MGEKPDKSVTLCDRKGSFVRLDFRVSPHSRHFLDVEIDFDICGWKSRAPAGYMPKDRLYKFGEDLRAIQNTLQGEVIFITEYQELRLDASVNHQGHIDWMGELFCDPGPDYEDNCGWTFSFHFQNDQSYLDPIIKDIGKAGLTEKLSQLF